MYYFMKIFKSATFLVLATFLFSIANTEANATNDYKSFCKSHAENIRLVYSYRLKQGLSLSQAQKKFKSDSSYQGHISRVYASKLDIKPESADSYLKSMYNRTLESCISSIEKRTKKR